uniref:protein phosphatase 1 regulatory inhibitor subunit 16B-like n=1 Tax=Myxine glutinosa TaxID=7769 RepID=UPI00358FBDA8
MEHEELVAEMPKVESLPVSERLKLARRRRAQQLKRWAHHEKEQHGQRKKRATKHKRPAASSAEPDSSACRVHFLPRVALLEASARNDVTEVRELLKSGVDSNLCNEDGLTALHQCCIDDFECVLKVLLQHGANVNALDHELWTPLHAAATCGHVHLVNHLISYGADLLAVNADGNMPYDICEDEATLDFIEAAMTAKGITQEVVNQRRAAPEVAMISDIEEAIKHDGNLDWRNEQGATLLHVAAAHGCVRVAEILLAHGVSVDCRDRDGWEPLHAAACWGQVEVAEMLVSHGASFDAKTNQDETAIDLCEDEGLKKHLLDLRHKQDAILKSQAKPRSSLQRRTSSAGSRGKVCRRASLRERSDRYRQERREEARLWLELESAERRAEGEGVEHSTQDVNELSDTNTKQPSQQITSSAANHVVLGNGNSQKPSRKQHAAPQPPALNPVPIGDADEYVSTAGGRKSFSLDGVRHRTFGGSDGVYRATMVDTHEVTYDLSNSNGGRRNDAPRQTLCQLKKQRAAAMKRQRPFFENLAPGVAGGSQENGPLVPMPEEAVVKNTVSAVRSRVAPVKDTIPLSRSPSDPEPGGLSSAASDERDPYRPQFRSADSLDLISDPKGMRCCVIT